MKKTAKAPSLVDNGLWFTITGNADNPDDLLKPVSKSQPLTVRLACKAKQLTLN